jgi:hypothetical protein
MSIIPVLPPGETIIEYTGSSVIYTIPSNGNVVARVEGAGGGGGSSGGGTALPGGAGGYVVGTFPVYATDTLKAVAGGGGGGSSTGGGSGLGGFPGGADGGFGGGGGGGFSNISLNITPLIYGAGGGGSSIGAAGGGGGVTDTGTGVIDGAPGSTAFIINSGVGGGGGTSVAGSGGAAGPGGQVGSDAIQENGGAGGNAGGGSNTSAGGGGGGYRGGGGGGGAGNIGDIGQSGGGGGGSSYYAPSVERKADGSVPNPGFNGANGRIVLTYIPDSEPVPVVCYAKGTQILTQNGYVKIEDLKASDLVVTTGTITNNHATQAKQSLQPIKWKGHFTVTELTDISRPVCIKAHAFGKNAPFEDLFVSPGHRIVAPRNRPNMLSVVTKKHAIVPAAALINGTSIVQDKSCKEVTYYHIELEQHAMVIANGIAAESYLEMKKNRNTFTHVASV